MPFPEIHPEPDFRRLETVLRRGVPDRVPFIELFLDEEVMVALREAPFSPEPAQRAREVTALYLQLGYDYVPAAPDVAFPYRSLPMTDTAGLPRARRQWVDESQGAIGSWEDFDRYPWPKLTDASYAPIEYAAGALPEGMKLIPHGPGGVLENVMWLMGYEPMGYAMADQPDLVQAMFDRVGETLVQVFATIAGHEAVGAIFLGDDMGFKTQPMISPAALRKYVFPWQRRIAEAVHARGKPFLLHACGNLESVMEDLIDDVGIDAKHSFEDVIMPVAAAKRRWGDRIALLGGVDVDFLTRAEPEAVRARTREVLEACMPGGGYALGTGNSVANYIPLGNYLAMLEEGWQQGAYA